MLSVHKAERLARLLDVAAINEEEGNTHVARKLKILRDLLKADSVHIPPEVTHTHMENWAMGCGPPMWETKPAKA